MSASVQQFGHSLGLPFFGSRMKTDLFQSCGHCWLGADILKFYYFYMEVSEAVSEDSGTSEFYQIWKRDVCHFLPQSSLLTKTSSSPPPPVVHPLDVFKLLFIIGHILLTLREPEMLLDSISSCIGPVLFQRNECKGQYFKAREAGWKRDRKYTRKYGVLGRNSPLCGQSYWHLQDRLWDFLEDAFSLRHLCLLSWVFYKVPRRSSEV